MELFELFQLHFTENLMSWVWSHSFRKWRALRQNLHRNLRQILLLETHRLFINLNKNSFAGSVIKHFQVDQQNQTINAKCKSTSFKCADEHHNIDKLDSVNRHDWMYVKCDFTKYFEKIPWKFFHIPCYIFCSQYYSLFQWNNQSWFPFCAIILQ